MPRSVLTDISVRALIPPVRGQITVWDANSPLGVRISEGGSKTFIVMIGSGQRQMIGRVGIVSLSEARAESRRIQAEKTLGLAKKPATIKFEKARDLFIENHYRDKRPRVKKEAKRLLEKHFAKLRSRPLSEVTDSEIGEALDKLSRTPSEQLHAFRVCRTFFRWCTRRPRRYLRHSPFEGFEPPSQDGKRTRLLSDDELVRLWNAADGMFGAIVKLLILTTARKMEIGAIRWEWIDEDNLLIIPGTARKNGKPLTLPLGPLAVSIISRQPRLGPYVFPGRKEGTHIHDGSFGKLKRALDEKANVNGYRLHDLRRTTATALAKQSTAPHVLQAILGHSTGPLSDLQAIYNKYEYLIEKRVSLARFEEGLTKLLAT